MEPDLLSAHDVAIRLGLSVDTVMHLARQGALPARITDDTYRFHPDDVRAFANRFPDADPPGDGRVNDLVRAPAAEPAAPAAHARASYDDLLKLARDLGMTAIMGAITPPLNGRMWIGDQTLEGLLLPDGQARQVVLAIAPGGPPRVHRALGKSTLDADGRARVEQAVLAAGGHVYHGRLALLTPRLWLEQHADRAPDARRQEQMATAAGNWTRDMQGAEGRSEFSPILPAAVAAGWPRNVGDRPTLFLDDKPLFHLMEKENVGRNVLLLVGEIAPERA